MDKSFEGQHLKFKHPCNISAFGASQSGKSFWVKKLIKEQKDLISPPVEKIVYCYSVWDPNFQIPGIDVFHEGIPSFEELKEFKAPTLLILDDLQLKLNENLAEIFTCGTHHLGISVIFLCQELFAKNKFARTVSLNSHYLVLFKFVRDKNQISFLARQSFPQNVPFFNSAYEIATKEPYSYLILDFTQTCPDEVRLRSNIFSDDKFPLTVFLPK